MWTLEFDETGGYDCISSAYVISNATTKERIVIDGRDFGWQHSWEIPMAGVKQRMHAVATATMVSLNKLDL